VLGENEAWRKPIPILRFLKFSNSRNWRLWPHDLPRSYVQAHFVTFTECFTIWKAHRQGTFLMDCTQIPHHPRPLNLGLPPPRGLAP